MRHWTLICATILDTLLNKIYWFGGQAHWAPERGLLDMDQSWKWAQPYPWLPPEQNEEKLLANKFIDMWTT